MRHFKGAFVGRPGDMKVRGVVETFQEFLRDRVGRDGVSMEKKKCPTTGPWRWIAQTQLPSAGPAASALGAGNPLLGALNWT